MRIMILTLCTFWVSAQMTLLNKIDHAMLPGKQFGNQFGPDEPIDDDVRGKNFQWKISVKKFSEKFQHGNKLTVDTDDIIV